VQFSGERQKTSCKLQFQSKYNAVQQNVHYCVSTTDNYRAEELRYLLYCGTEKYHEGDCIGTIEKWYRGATVVPWYRATATLLIFEVPGLTLIMKPVNWQ